MIGGWRRSETGSKASLLGCGGGCCHCRTSSQQKTIELMKETYTSLFSSARYSPYIIICCFLLHYEGILKLPLPLIPHRSLPFLLISLAPNICPSSSKESIPHFFSNYNHRRRYSQTPQKPFFLPPLYKMRGREQSLLFAMAFPISSFAPPRPLPFYSPPPLPHPMVPAICLGLLNEPEWRIAHDFISVTVQSQERSL